MRHRRPPRCGPLNNPGGGHDDLIASLGCVGQIVFLVCLAAYLWLIFPDIARFLLWRTP